MEYGECITQTLSFKLSMIIAIFLLFVLFGCGSLTYYDQMLSYRQQCKTNLQNAGDYLDKLIEADGQDFVRYQTYFLAHYKELNIPIDAQEYMFYKVNYEHLFHMIYPGKTLGVDIELDDLSTELQHAYMLYRQLYWHQVFENARTSFGLTYVYYILPDSETESDIYIIDGTHPSRAEYINLMAEHPELFDEFYHFQGEETEYLYLGSQVPNKRNEYGVKWAAWDSGEKHNGFQTWDNEYGKTYANYIPIVINGRKMGMIGTEIDIETVNTTILQNTLRQFIFIGIVVAGGILIMMNIINRRYISKIIALEANVKDYSKTRDFSISEKIRKSIQGSDEISSLSEEVAKMIDKIRDYIDNLLEINHELDMANTNVTKMSELALRDSLTGVRNHTAYSQEVAKLGEMLAENETKFAIAVIDLNNLKKINDVYGHDKGNIAIVKLSLIVCEIFKHSMIFRVGGDEFLIILLNEDYENRYILIQRTLSTFDTLKQNENLPLWEKTSAAIGLATYDREQDTSVQDVTRRADAMMYEQKKKMKAKEHSSR